MIFRRAFVLTFALLATVAACSPTPENVRPLSVESPPPSSAAFLEVAPAALAPPDAAAFARAVAARDALFAALSARLQSEIVAHGAAHAISVCQSAAPQLTAEIGAAHDVTIGRTSDRLRNLSNVAPSWAATSIARRPTEPIALLQDSSGPDRVAGAVLPIRVAGLCLQCHGDPKAIAPDVAEAIRFAYPEDRATGYAEGDLRGWFWIDVRSGSQETHR